MGNTSSRDNSEDKKTYLKALGRRKSGNELATIPTRLSSNSRQSVNSYWNKSSSTLDIHPQQQKQQDNHNHGLLDRIKHSNKSKHVKNSIISHSAHSHHYYENSAAAEDYLERSTSPAFSNSSLSKFEFNESISEVLIIEKYADSQMTLLNHNHQLSQFDNQLYMENNSNSTLNTTTTTTTSNEFSSDILLNELFMLCETSPERRRDRDR
jgi:hypothetical protein